MRWAPAVALLCCLAACRRSEPRPEAAATPPAASAPAAPAAEAEAPAPEAVPEPEATPPSEPEPAPATATVAAAPEPTPPPAEQAAATARTPAQEEDPDALYSWIDEQGELHYGSADDVPADRRRSARVVSSGLTLVPSEPPSAPPAAGQEGQIAQPAAPDARETRRGDQPELDDKGLPIPGTMKDTAATQAAKQAGETQLDPAAVERRHQEELRRMNCREKDGVMICG